MRKNVNIIRLLLVCVLFFWENHQIIHASTLAYNYDYTTCIVNHSFEDGINGWNVVSQTFTTSCDWAFEGSCRLKMSGKVNPKIKQVFPIQNGEYRLIFKYSAGNFDATYPSVRVNGVSLYDLVNASSVEPSVEFRVTSGLIVLEISGSGLPSNGWLDIDNFRLYGNQAPVPDAPVNIHVDAADVIKDLYGNAIGVNANYVNDAQANRPAGSQSLGDALKDMNARIVRYPGGQKSNYYCWSTPDVDYAYPKPALSRYSTAPGDFPSTTYWEPAANPNGSFKYTPLDFDAFIVEATIAGAEANIVINYNNLRVPPLNGGTAINFEEGLNMAVAWVRYANITKGYGIKYWSIGNEVYNPLADGSYMTAEQYGQDVAVFSKAMKAIDPDILIGLCIKDVEWMNAALEFCMEDVDFIDCHNYPIYRAYENFHNWDAQWLHPEISVAINRLPEPHRSRIFIAVTECGANTDSNEAPTVGNGLENFNVLTNAIGQEKIRFAQFWTTRYTTPNVQMWYNSLYEDNTLNANGLAISVLSGNLLDKLISSVSSNNLRVPPFATLSSDGKYLNLFLMNKSYAQTTATVELSGFMAAGAIEQWVYSGTNESDTSPVFTQKEDIPVSDGNTVTLTLSPISITVLKVQASENPGTFVPRVETEEDNGLQVYPSVFNDRVYFRFHTNETGNAVLRISNAGGQLVEEIFFRDIQPGEQSFSWENKRLSSGIYIYSFTLGKKEYSGKLIKK